MVEAPRWEFWVDRGGTFTDVVGRRPDGSLVTLKLLSENPDQYRDAPVEGIRRLLDLAPDAPITPDLVAGVKMGTTVATNALLERRGEPTLLVITEGFGDALRIAYQDRPDIFAQRIELPELLYSEVIEGRERVGADGEIVTPLDEAHLRAALTTAHATGLNSVAIVFMHGYRFPRHEQAAATIARQVGFDQVSVSHEVSPLMKLVGRGDTTVVDAYLSPILRRYVDQVTEQMPGVPLYFMQSSGGLADAHAFQGKDAILSGPAGGVVGMVRTAEIAGGDLGTNRIIGFDMGGTSTDVTHYAGEYERAFETQVAGVRLQTPIMSIHTVAAGGGSVIEFDGARLRVGPHSAGADPGPACYRRGGPLAVTDANVLLGRIQSAHFPRIFGPNADESLDADAVQARFSDLAATIAAATGTDQTPEQVAEGCLDIAVGAMAGAIKKISIARGHDVTQYVLQCFGGAAGQHACQVADALGITRVFVHPLAGVLSAYGMGLADQNVIAEAAIELPLADAAPALRDRLDALATETTEALRHQGVAADAIRLERRVHLRYAGTDSGLVVPYDAPEAMRESFETAYLARFAFLMHDRALVVESVTVEAIGSHQPFTESATDELADGPAPSATTIRLYADRTWWTAPLVHREDASPGHTIEGPALIAEANATTFVAPGWRARVTALGHLVLDRVEAPVTRRAIGANVDPIMLEVFNNLFMNIAEQMGEQLRQTAYSVNIKERLDFSCALFDGHGDLIANAPHIPVHLGSMSESIKSVVARNADRMRPGDVYLVNDPYHGGTHLPDLTVVTPVYLPGQEEPSFYVASRGHHADLGGLTPGSMPPFSTHIDEEGIQFDNVVLIEGGRFREAEIVEMLTSGPYPARNPQQNLADLRAQVAANEKGVAEVRAMVDEFGHDVVAAYMQHVQDNAEESVRRAISTLADGTFTLPLDNGAQITVAISVDPNDRSAVIDFTGTSAQLPNNFNAPTAVCMAAVLYVFRTLVDDDIPLNAGCLKPLEVRILEGSMLAPTYPAAVVAGNVETSSCITNALYGLLGTMAAAQCTVNNLTFGNAEHQYYETISGGSGAGPGFDGTSVVQTHMTNSRLTDPEVLEFRYPVRLDEYAIRRGSGGAGRWHGGDGGTRRVRFLETMTASILSNGRTVPAFGLAGGSPGALGANHVERADGRVEELGHIASVTMSPGDVFVVETPGGGGYGAPAGPGDEVPPAPTVVE
ncbi:hydantoinase B/oxoprolinase family protein [Kribbia dieselivorans]|uniref:hydantoinase B/oxoprolinase family protein n=1 Tax=Kribbia dieselivorans TaxID=331526 RepID=UPI000837C432|nr:hydantoinase B/oxoprolinase family protein [Kribbia dieselivorans]